MVHFWGTVQGNKGEAARAGHTGMETYCASWEGAIRCHAYKDESGADFVRVEMVRWHGNGTNQLIYEGPIGIFAPQNSPLREAALGEKI